MRAVTAGARAMQRLEQLVDQQAEEVAQLRSKAAEQPPVYLRHHVTGTVHQLRPNDQSRFICGIAVVGATHRARRQDNSQVYLPLDKFEDTPGILLCDRCLKLQRAIALERELIEADISGDEVES